MASDLSSREQKLACTALNFLLILACRSSARTSVFVRMSPSPLGASDGMAWLSGTKSSPAESAAISATV